VGLVDHESWLDGPHRLTDAESIGRVILVPPGITGYLSGMSTTVSLQRANQQFRIIPPVVTDATAPALLGMSPRQFREAVTRQRVPFMKLGQRMVVFLADLKRLAHRNASPSDAHPEPRDHHNRRLAATTQMADFMESIEPLDERDAVNAILGRLGRQLTDEAYRNYKPRKP
jgi:hypothetical protein